MNDMWHGPVNGKKGVVSCCQFKRIRAVEYDWNCLVKLTGYFKKFEKVTSNMKIGFLCMILICAFIFLFFLKNRLYVCMNVSIAVKLIKDVLYIDYFFR